MNLLGLTDQLVLVSRTTPAAQNRYLHLPGNTGLSPIPSSFFALLTSPLGRTMLEGVLWDMWQSANMSKSSIVEGDESVYSFLERRFGAEFARTFGSAFVHGVYAADARQLSVKAAFPDLPALAEKGSGSVVRGGIASGIEYLFGYKEDSVEEKARKEGRPYDLGDVNALMQGVSVFSLKEGLQQLVKALEERLAGLKNVQIVKGSPVVEIQEGELFEVRTAPGQTYAATHLVSALPLPALERVLVNSPTVTPLPHLTANKTSTVVVVNLVFSVPPEKLHPAGFGYLVPRPAAEYGSTSGGDGAREGENPLGVLGTVFDSCALAAQDSNALHFTKMTTILGGPYALPSSSSLVPDLLSTLKTQLAITGEMPEPVLVRVHHHEGCIPVPGVGHLKRMEEVKEMLKGDGWEGRLEVIGAGVGGVSVGACVEAGRNVGLKW